MVLHIVIHGRVQGVGFRWFVREAARRLDLAGWVRNRPEGSVEVAAEGDDTAVESLRRAIEHGPPGAMVRSVDETIPPPDQPLDRPFTILR